MVSPLERSLQYKPLLCFLFQSGDKPLDSLGSVVLPVLGKAAGQEAECPDWQQQLCKGGLKLSWHQISFGLELPHDCSAQLRLLGSI